MEEKQQRQFVKEEFYIDWNGNRASVRELSGGRVIYFADTRLPEIHIYGERSGVPAWIRPDKEVTLTQEIDLDDGSVLKRAFSNVTVRFMDSE